MPGETEQLTSILEELGTDDGSAASRLMPLVYDELRALAGSFFNHQRPDHTLQPTALVHEAFVRVVGTPDQDWSGRDHFLAVAAKAMRQILVDHARRHRAAKRGRSWHRVTLDGETIPGREHDLDCLDLDTALEELTKLDARKGQVVTLRFFGGLTNEAVARVLGVSRKTVVEDWTFARAWLGRALRRETDA